MPLQPDTVKSLVTFLLLFTLPLSSYRQYWRYALAKEGQIFYPALDLTPAKRCVDGAHAASF
jgi:hypothetical protein